MSSGARVPSSKESGETVEGNVIQCVPELRYVSDRTAEWHDAETIALFEPPHDAVTFYGINLLAVGIPVEIKAAQIWYESGQRGRFYIRKRQHERLLDAGGAYLFAVYVPRPDHPVRAMGVMPASLVDELLPDGWTSRDRSGEEGYRQLAWSRILDPADVEETRR